MQSAEFTAAMANYERQVAALERLFDERGVELHPGADTAACASLIGDIVRQFNALNEQAHTLGPYINSFVSTDSHNTLARHPRSRYKPPVRCGRSRAGWTPSWTWSTCGSSS